VPETKQVYDAMESMIQTEGARLILGTSYGYFNPFMVDLAKKYPKVELRHSTTLWDKDKHPANLGGYFCYLDRRTTSTASPPDCRRGRTRSASSRRSRSRSSCAT